MKNQPKLRNPPRPLFSCGIFGHCTQTVLSPTTPSTPILLPSPPPPPPPPPPPIQPESPSPCSSSSSTTNSQSFTQWKFPLPNNPPLLHNPLLESDPPLPSPPESDPPPHPQPLPESDLAELYHLAELQFASGSNAAKYNALRFLERSLVPNPLPAAAGVGGSDGGAVCPVAVMEGVIGFLKDTATAKSAVKVLLAVCLAEWNRQSAVEAGAVAAVVEAMAGLSGVTAERALAVLELLCTVAEGAAELRGHALAVPLLVELLAKMTGRGAEYAISMLAAIYGGGGGIGELTAETAPPAEAVAQVVLLVLQGDCSARTRRKGIQLLKALQESGGLDFAGGC